MNLGSLGKAQAVLLASAFAGCALQPDYEAPRIDVVSQWQAQRPHGGSVVALADWWERFDDPVVAELIGSAETDSPTLAQSVAQIKSARAALSARGMTTALGAAASGSIARTGAVDDGASTARSGALDASWEIDLFGKLRSGREAARAELDASLGDWHDARVSLAAEVADTYVQYRACRLLSEAYRFQSGSQAETLRATHIAVEAGLSPPVDGYLAAASAASANQTRSAQQSECDQLVKALVALVGMDEKGLRSRIDGLPHPLPEPAGFDVSSVPADLLRQRPDLIAVERRLAARYAEIGEARADRLPSLSLGGTISISASSATASSTSWSFGPSLSVPLFDGGKRRAAVDSGVAGYEQQLAVYRAAVRTAVKEVEQALVQLEGTKQRSEDARLAVEQYRRYAGATAASWRAGLESLLTLEQARRSAISAEVTYIQLQRDRVRGWIALYKALGGGWTPAPQQEAGQ